MLDPHRHQAYSGAMDDTARVWDLRTGTCRYVLKGHVSLVGLLSLSPSYLVSASADATLRVWNPDTGEQVHTFDHRTGAVTAVAHDEYKVLSGAEGSLKLWDIRSGAFVRNLLTDITGVWQVALEGRWCVAATNRANKTMLEIWDFDFAEKKA